jgi:hypothetical protein
MRALLAILVAAVTPAMKHTTADTTAARASLVTVSDFGKGWSGKASPQAGLVFGCTGFHPSGQGIVETGAASSATIQYDTIGPFVFQKTSVFATTTQANTYWQRSVTPKLITCVSAVLRAVSRRGVKVTITSQGKLPFSAPLPRSAAYRAVGTLASAKNTVRNYVDVIVLEQGRAITAITISSFKIPPPASFEKALAKIVAARLGSPGAA